MHRTRERERERDTHRHSNRETETETETETDRDRDRQTETDRVALRSSLDLSETWLVGACLDLRALYANQWSCSV